MSRNLIIMITGAAFHPKNRLQYAFAKCYCTIFSLNMSDHGWPLNLLDHLKRFVKDCDTEQFDWDHGIL